jgi:hypothetical protein
MSADEKRPNLNEKRRLKLQYVLNRCSVIAGIFDTRMDSVNCKQFHAIREIMDIYVAAGIRAINSNVDFLDENMTLKEEEKASLNAIILRIFGDQAAKSGPGGG